MSPWVYLAAGVGILALAYAALIATLLVLGRREDARAVAGFVPDCTVLFSRLIKDPALPRRRWLVLGLVTAYLAMPFDLIPDFLPGIGYLDDALVVVLALRWFIRAGGREAVEAHWPGPRSSLRVLLSAAEA